MKNLGATEIIFILFVVFALFGFGWMARTRAMLRRVRRTLQPRKNRRKSD